MKRMMIALISVVAAGVVQAEMVTVTDAAANDYGATSGVAIDFDATTGLTANWNADLVSGQQYEVDSISLYLGAQGTINEDLYLGIYTGLDEQIGVQAAATLSGFLGVSQNTINLATAPLDTALTWTFADGLATVTSELNPGTGGDVLYFVLQTGTGALADVGVAVNGSRSFRRIDGTVGTFDDELSAVIHGSRNGTLTDPDIVTGRALEYSATVTAIPEPATMGLVALFGGGLLFIRRRLSI